MDTGDSRDVDPRFTSCLVVDGERLGALVEILGELRLPPLSCTLCAETREEKADALGTREGV